MKFFTSSREIKRAKIHLESLYDNLEIAQNKLAIAHKSRSILWIALANIHESETAKPGGTVKKMLRIAEQALLDDPIGSGNPTPKWTL